MSNWTRYLERRNGRWLLWDMLVLLGKGLALTITSCLMALVFICFAVLFYGGFIVPLLEFLGGLFMSDSVLQTIIICGMLTFISTFIATLVFRSEHRSSSGKNEFDRAKYKMQAEAMQHNQDVALGNIQITHTPRAEKN